MKLEYQAQTIGKYDLGYDGKNFLLIAKTTACLAPDLCGVPAVKPKVQLQNLAASGSVCTPGGGCC